MILLPGSGEFHSKILWWDKGSAGGYSGDLMGRVEGWNWNANHDDCDTLGTFSPIDPGEAPYNIFCSSLIHLADGRALLSGGTDPGEIGSNKSVYFDPAVDPGENPWSLLDNSMESRRWYPTAQLLPDGRALVYSGSKYSHMVAWGGTSVPGSYAAAQGDLRRLQLTDDPAWDPAISHDTGWPAKRYGHSMTSIDQYAKAIVGGRKDNGDYVMDVWQLLVHAEPMQSDFRHEWVEHELTPGSQIPAGRIGHSAFFLNDGSLIVYGGRNGSQVFDQVWRRTSGAQRVWQGPLTQEPVEAGGPLPGGRFGQTLVYQDSDEPPVRNRALVFGGATTTGGSLADNDVWELTIEINEPPLESKAKWRKLVLEFGSPAPPSARYEHAMTPDDLPRKRVPTEAALPRFFISGGRGAAGTLSNQLWELWDADVYAPADTVAWGTGPSAPTARAGHSLIYDGSYKRLVTMGGDTGAGADDDVWWISFDDFGWNNWVDDTPTMGSPSLVGHTAFAAPGRVFARQPERLKPEAGTGGIWDSPLNAPLLQEWYPFQFTIANGPHAGKSFNAGPSAPTYLLDLSTPSWTQWPAPSDFVGGSAVLYRPDRVMKCGSRDTEDDKPPPAAVATTKVIALDQAMPSWTASTPMDSGRVNHNLTLLPSGEVLVTGGTRFISNGLNAEQAQARGIVELWRPPDATYPNGVWYGGHSTPALEKSIAARDYHSTALLLPDGRVLTAGGEHSPEKFKAQIYCPPYLFNANGTAATRPQITSAPTVPITYGEPFVIGKQASDIISSACLIRPGAVTHGYNQDQRYLPLTFEVMSTTGLRAIAPTSGRVAPPGDYLLFILNQSGVPAVAKWVRLGQCPTIPCDTESPPAVGGLSADFVGPSRVLFTWEAPGDDTSPLTGVYDLRTSVAAITTEAQYAGASQKSGEPAVQPAGTPISFEVSAAPCAQFWVAMKTRDGTGSFKNWSLLSNTAFVETMYGGCGGGFGAERVEEEQMAGGSAAALVSDTSRPLAGAAAVSSLELGAGVLEAVTHRTLQGGWQVTLRRLAQAEGVDADDAGAIVSQVPDGGGGWKTRGRFRPLPEEGPLGLCALRPGGRAVFPSGYALDRVVSGIKAGGQELALSAANHSRLGSLGGESIDVGGGVEMALGDALTLSYAPSGTALPGATGWYLSVRATGGSESSATPARRALATRIPARFALHQNQPNPFGRATTIAFDLPVASPVTLEVFDLLGRRVATLAQGEHPAGAHTVEYDLREAGGVSLRAGVYVYRLRAGTFEDQRKLTVLP